MPYRKSTRKSCGMRMDVREEFQQRQCSCGLIGILSCLGKKLSLIIFVCSCLFVFLGASLCNNVVSVLGIL